jgi:penicillin-binding protein A
MFRVSEHLESMPGVGVMVDSTRNYVYADLFDTFLGRVGPIPTDEVERYLAKGYAMNELVGLGNTLEFQYEDQLRGKPSVTEIAVDRAQRPMGEPEHMPGQRGNDLMLTIDVELQQKIEEVTNELIEEHDDYTAGSDQAPQFVAMDPNTGEILGMSNNVFTYRAGQYPPGSTIKMATVLMGLHEGVRTPNETVYDNTIYLGANRQPLRSWSTLEHVNARTAIQRSSNIYMAQTVLEMAGASQGSDRQWSVSVEAARETMEVMRDYFAQFGLGVKTGIDLPGESSGRKAPVEAFGALALNSFGQYDEYTPLQLAQFVSTIANDGYRMEPHLVKEIRRGTPENGELGEVVWQKQPKVLNRIEMSDEYLQVVREGMEMVTQTERGTAYGMFGDFEVKVAAKTGTAQTNREGINHALLVGYAPADDPQIAFAAIAPYSLESRNETAESWAQKMSKDILEFYFDDVVER